MKLHLLLSLVLLTGSNSEGQLAWFTKSTDTIEVQGQTILEDDGTIEAVFMLPSSLHSEGLIFNEWTFGQEDKSLLAGFALVSAVFYQRLPNLELADLRGVLELDKFHHVAFVSEGPQERLFIDGRLVAEKQSAEAIGNGLGLAYIGAIFRDGRLLPGFVGYLDSIRISNAARFRGIQFEPPSGDLSSDASTVLLYNFNDSADSATVRDESSLNRTGTLGAGFDGATKPRIVTEVSTQAPIGLQAFPAIELQFMTSVNTQAYVIQASDDLSVWRDFSTVTVNGNGGLTNALISTRPTAFRFYRVVVRPP